MYWKMKGFLVVNDNNWADWFINQSTIGCQTFGVCLIIFLILVEHWNKIKQEKGSTKVVQSCDASTPGFTN